MVLPGHCGRSWVRKRPLRAFTDHRAERKPLLRLDTFCAALADDLRGIRWPGASIPPGITQPPGDGLV